MIVLGSTSKYRAELLTRLGLPFTTANPECDETRLDREQPERLAARLAHNKARSLVSRHPKSIIIGSDQVASIGDKVLGKPIDRKTAAAQLDRMQGETVTFFTAISILDGASKTHLRVMDKTKATLRNLTEDEIERYIAADNPLDCAGSFKVESLGISLFDSIETKDPTGLVGLPLIGLCKCLRELGMELP